MTEWRVSPVCLVLSRGRTSGQGRLIMIVRLWELRHFNKDIKNYIHSSSAFSSWQARPLPCCWGADFHTRLAGSPCTVSCVWAPLLPHTQTPPSSSSSAHLRWMGYVFPRYLWTTSAQDSSRLAASGEIRYLAESPSRPGLLLLEEEVIRAGKRGARSFSRSGLILNY